MATTIDIENPGDAAAELKAALFALLTSDGSALFTQDNFNSAIAEYLKIADASTLYETLSDIRTTFLKIVDAAATYETIANALATYETITNATQTYATISGVQSAYLPFTGGTITGNLTVSGNHLVIMDGPNNGAFHGYRILNNGSLRWHVGAAGTETGDRTGSDFHFYGYDDDGSLIDSAITITRASLVTNFVVRPTWAGFIPWDNSNFSPGNYVTTINANATFETIDHAAATYLTITDAENTYTTPAEVNTALATFETIAHAAATYQPKGVQSNFTSYRPHTTF